MHFNIYSNTDNFQKINTIKSELLFSHKNPVKAPLVSIIITLYKRENCIYEAINSALYQENIDFEYEIIVLNDNPGANLLHINDYIDMDNIFFYRNPVNLGLFNNLNMGAFLARGKYIAYLHDDDLLYPGYLYEIHRFLTKKPEAKCVLVNRDTRGLSSRENPPSNIHSFIKFVLIPCSFIKEKIRKPFKKITLTNGLTYVLSNLYKAPSCGTLFERDSFIRLGGYNDLYYPVSDYFFFLAFNRLHMIYMLREKLACYRWIENLSQQKSVQFASLRWLNSFFKLPPRGFFVNIYYKIFHNEIFHAKYVMIDSKYRAELENEFSEIKKFNKFKWTIFKSFNMIYKYINDFV